MNTRQQDRLLLIGRVLVSAIFIMSGLMKIGMWGMIASVMSAKGVPMVPFTLAVTILLEAGGGILLLLGYRARIAAFALLLFMIPTTLVMHNFWAVSGAGQQAEMANFMKNFALMGGLLITAAAGAGAYSLDGRREREGMRFQPARA